MHRLSGIEEVAISETPHAVQSAAFYAVIVCWWLFALTFWLRNRPPRARESKRDWTSFIGLFLQSAAYAIVWFYPLQQQFRPVRSGSPVVEWGLAVLTVPIAVASVWLVKAAPRRCGRRRAVGGALEAGTVISPCRP